jgi:formyltetrahydrofolate deformylase
MNDLSKMASYYFQVFLNSYRMKHSTSPKFTLIVSCKDAVGIVAAVAGFVSENNGSLIESNHHTDSTEDWFFMRNVIDVSKMSIDVEAFRAQFSSIAKAFEMKWYIRDHRFSQKVIILVSRASHCLSDLLYRWKAGDLPCDIPCVISNHENLRSMVEWHGIPFHHVPVPKNNKEESFAKTQEIIERHQAESIVLARYMQILPEEICQQYPGRLINIHHSFLPSFVGADPYKKAFDRGVKLIGATCHYVTKDLDEGPIIEQDVIRVGHHCDKAEMVRRGRDVERAVLSRGLLYHLQDRVIVQGNKTIVFN